MGTGKGKNEKKKEVQKDTNHWTFAVYKEKPRRARWAGNKKSGPRNSIRRLRKERNCRSPGVTGTETLKERNGSRHYGKFMQENRVVGLRGGKRRGQPRVSEYDQSRVHAQAE